MDKFTESYIETMLWSSLEDDGKPLDDTYTVDDLSTEALNQIHNDCEAFQKENEYLIVRENIPSVSPDEIGGRDFWLTRNRHGAGFWDGDWTEPAASKLTESAKRYGEVYPYVGDDGLVYLA